MNVPDYLNNTERPKDLETSLQQNEDLRTMLRMVYSAYTYYRNHAILWQAVLGFLGGVCGCVLFNLIIKWLSNG